MASFTTERVRQFYAEIYDTVVSDWPGETDFYRDLARQTARAGHQVLEIACGTGRVAVRLAQDGVDVVGLDISSGMLSVARQKSVGLQQVRWVCADMRSFDLGESFGLVIIPGHSFQNILTADDQLATLRSIRRHLNPSGTLVVHLDHLSMDWLGELTREWGGVFEPAESFRHPTTGQQIRTQRAWSYEPAAQTAVSEVVWEAFDASGEAVERWESGPLRFHCVFRFEMEHLLGRAGYEMRSVCGDFCQGRLRGESSEMIWVATNG